MGDAPPDTGGCWILFEFVVELGAVRRSWGQGTSGVSDSTQDLVDGGVALVKCPGED